MTVALREGKVISRILANVSWKGCFRGSYWTLLLQTPAACTMLVLCLGLLPVFYPSTVCPKSHLKTCMPVCRSTCPWCIGQTSHELNIPACPRSLFLVCLAGRRDFLRTVFGMCEVLKLPWQALMPTGDYITLTRSSTSHRCRRHRRFSSTSWLYRLHRCRCHR